MSLKIAVLGELVERPAYGYLLARRLADRIEGGNVSDSTVYPALYRLEAADPPLVQRRLAPGGVGVLPSGPITPRHRDRVWWEATEAGRNHFRAWFGQPLKQPPLRDELRLRIALARVEDLPHLLCVLDDLEQDLVNRLQALAGPVGATVDELIDSAGEWEIASKVWLRRSEIQHLSATIDIVHDARTLMEHVLLERDRR